jgi:hypothetical protein
MARTLAWGMTHVKMAILGRIRIRVTGLDADRRGCWQLGASNVIPVTSF